MTQTTNFSRLESAIQLIKAGRVNAAKSEWNLLETEFKIKILQVVGAFFRYNNEEILSCPNVTLNCKWGQFQLNPQVALDWMTYIEQLAS